ncbi:hypothetical protein [Rhodococcus sp. 14-2470-1a]|uniref:hypothetical protein n=1 Tax=Rhodococcus sp. 14-2470-1a TaxID=2023150 RepID=UPI000B9C5777|nr:hypothetical protein [Rhodococcus sp. 14-2470-1a]OZF41933.1 hypothetical protein CH292_27390 [Rhodococcus sp. 14-2470-1a]
MTRDGDGFDYDSDLVQLLPPLAHFTLHRDGTMTQNEPPAPPADPDAALLAAIRTAVGRRNEARAIVAAAEERRDQLVREALAAGILASDVAAAAGLSKPRMYQIRDRRR